MTPLVGVLVGSKSGMLIIEKCTTRLDELEVKYEIEVRSAHRNPDLAEKLEGTGS